MISEINQIPPMPEAWFRVIPPADLMSEAVIQAEFYRVAVSIGLRVTLEMCTPVGRLDIAVFNNQWTQLLAVIEVKHNQEKKVRFSWQIKRYKELGVPVYGLADMARCERLAKQIKDNHIRGVGLDAIQRMKPRIQRRRMERRCSETL